MVQVRLNVETEPVLTCPRATYPFFHAVGIFLRSAVSAEGETK